MKDTILVDGYNVVNAWPELISLKANLEQARDRLVDRMACYGAFNNLKVVVVFDAQAVLGVSSCQKISDDLEIIYTGETETADSYIEKLVYDLVRRQRKTVYVVTSDWAEQLAILGTGAYRISARELLENLKKMDKLIAEGFTDSTLTYRRHELGNRLSSEVLKQLDEIRRKS
ncbi:MAG TPA: NYN domain-containing protein [Negativicutes bacterium]